jgi:hypothetical protein
MAKPDTTVDIKELGLRPAVISIINNLVDQFWEAKQIADRAEAEKADVKSKIKEYLGYKTGEIKFRTTDAEGTPLNVSYGTQTRETLDRVLLIKAGVPASVLDRCMKVSTFEVLRVVEAKGKGGVDAE